MTTTPLEISIDLDASPWRDLPPGPQIIHGQMTRVGLLPQGTVGGKASVAVVAKTADGQTIIIETTWALFNIAAHALAASPIAESERPD